MKVLFLSLKQQYEELKSEINKAVLKSLNSGWYILGEECVKFENNFKKYLVGDSEGYVVGVNSGTDALRISLLACEVGYGDEVITVANTAIPTVSAICSVGAKPIFCDVDKDTWLLDHKKLEKLITKKTKAIIPVHLYGFTADMHPICKIAKKYNLAVVEDVAQATGALYKNRMSGTIGDYGAFSFYPTKNIGCCGDGGAIFTRSKDNYERIKMLRNYGQSSKYCADIEGGVNSRLDEIQAAILIVKLKYLNKWNSAKSKMAVVYKNKIDSLNLSLQYQSSYQDTLPAYHIFAVKIMKGNRGRFLEYMKKNGIEILIHYPVPIYAQKAFLAYKREKLDITDDLTNRIVSLPFHQYMKQNEIKYVFKVLSLYENEKD